MKKIIVLLLLSTTVALAGCASHGSVGWFNSGNLIQVELSEANYVIVKRGLVGASHVKYFHLFGIFRTSGTGQLYQKAVSELWASFENTEGSAAGRALALVNVVQDYEVSWGLLGLTRTITLTVRADVVEFSSSADTRASSSLHRRDYVPRREST